MLALREQVTMNGKLVCVVCPDDKCDDGAHEHVGKDGNLFDFCLAANGSFSNLQSSVWSSNDGFIVAAFFQFGVVDFGSHGFIDF